MRTINFDVIILGSGIAGCTAAYHLAKQGKKIALVSSSANVWGINSARAQGGIVSEDGDGMLVSDIMAAGDEKNDRGVVEDLVRLGPPLVNSFLLEELEIPFDERKTKEAAHSCSRILFSNDQTGLAIMENLLKAVSLKKEITFVTKRRGVELLTHDGECLGLYVLGEEGTTLFTADATILATGGVGDLYAHTSNSVEAKGDGIALAHQAGAKLADLHYVQFHPTSFHKQGERSFLLTEALRGEGGLLLNREGKEFCDPLAPRDEVTRAIYQEMPGVFLDVRHLGEKYLRERFPGIDSYLLKHEIDFTKELVPTVPCAHYHCGGIKATLAGETSVPRLYAIGETACTGVHGANRLASTSLLEGLVMGALICEKIADQKPAPKISPPEKTFTETKDDFTTIQNIMWNDVGIVRDPIRLQKAATALHALSLQGSPRHRAAATAAHLIATSAQNASSAGCHFLLETKQELI